ncbi:MAG TPA: hypothetical protein VMB80_11110 [Candidatus Acidoferrum sp.]|nr:hypothetical protein [Candidatus Acidoferrum sp.]
MKKICVVLSLAAVLTATSAFASMSVTLTENTSQYSYGVGGEFRATGDAGLDAVVAWGAYSAATSGGSGSSRYFQTFCIEHNEYFTPGTPYSASISPNAMYGSQPPLGDPISIGTAWLYSQFAAGTLSGYNYTYGSGRASATSAGALQEAIWWLEGESGGVNNSFIALAETALGLNNTTIKNDANGAYGVYALNLGNPGAVQDQLVIVPEATTVIAGALLLLPLGASTLRVLRRNRE